MTRNETIVEIWYNRFWNACDTSVGPEITHADISFRGSLGERVQGYHGLIQYMRKVQKAFPDFTNAIEEIVSEKQRSFVRLSYRGTHKGEIMGIQPTGCRVQYAGAALFTFQDGRILDLWVLGDIQGLLQQLRHSEPGKEPNEN